MIGDKEIRRKLKELMKERGWNVDHTARLLGVARNTLENVLDEMGVMRWAPKTRDKVKALINQYERK